MPTCNVHGHFAPGSISEGTLRPQDLLRSFAGCYRAMAPFNHHKLYDEAHTFAALLDCDDPSHEEYQLADEILTDLIEEINYLLPDGYWFGATDGDGACFGIWEEADTDEAW
jgi:hypothetical protein